MKKITLFYTIGLISISMCVKSQNVAINTTGTAANSSSMLDISAGTSNNKGLLIPRVTNAQRTAMNPLPVAAQGLMVFQTDGAQGLYYNISNTTTPTWIASASDWGLTGNTGTVSGTNFLGNTDDVPLQFRVNNVQSAYLGSSLIKNVFFGYEAGAVNTASTGTFIGYRAGALNSTGTLNTFIGSEAGRDNSTGTQNVYIGPSVAKSMTNGDRNVVIGSTAGQSAFSYSNNVIIGSAASNFTGNVNYSVKIGSYSGFNAATDSCVYIGHRSGYAAAGTGSVLIGYEAGAVTGIGISGTLNRNTKVGFRAGFGSANCGVGFDICGNNDNTMFGYKAGESVAADNNAFFGSFAGQFTTSSNNVFMGAKSGFTNTTGSGNTYIGYNANGSATLTNAAAIGNGASVTASNNMVLGNNSTSVAIGATSALAGVKLDVVGGMRTSGANSGLQFWDRTTSRQWQWYASGDVAAIWNGAANIFSISAAGNATFSGTVTASCGVLICSDKRYKKDILNLNSALSNVLKLRGVSYFLKTDEFADKNFSKAKQVGFIAQEIEMIYPEVVNTDEKGFKSVDYSKLTPILVEAIKEQQKIIDRQTNENIVMKADIENLKEIVSAEILLRNNQTAEVKK